MIVIEEIPVGTASPCYLEQLRYDGVSFRRPRGEIQTARVMS